MNIRQATIADAEQIGRLHVETWQTSYRGVMPDGYLDAMSVEHKTKQWAEELAKPKEKLTTLVAESEGAIVGVVSVEPADEDPSAGELDALYIHPKYQRQGLGKALLEKGLSALKEQGFTKAILWALKANANAIAFYESQGWKYDNVEQDSDRDSVPVREVRYSKAL